MQTKELIMRKSLGRFTPSAYLSNLAVMLFEGEEFKSRRIAPIVPVTLAAGHFFEFRAEELGKIHVHAKPNYDAVAPAQFGISEHSYSCQPFQIMLGIDELIALNYERAAAGGLGVDIYREKTRIVVEQINMHIERLFAEKFFSAQAWSNTWTGAAAANVAQKKFKKFSDATVDPVEFIDARITEIKKYGRRRPNKLALGADVFAALKNNPAILNRIKYSGSAAEPAVVNENVLAQIFGLERVVVLDTAYNGANGMDFIADAKSALLLYSPNAPAMDVPSAVYCFAWNISGNDYITISEVDGSAGSHARFVEGLTCLDMKKTSDALAVFMAECV